MNQLSSSKSLPHKIKLNTLPNQPKTHNNPHQHTDLIRPTSTGRTISLTLLNDKIILQALTQNDYKTSSVLLDELHILIQKQEYGANRRNYFYHLYVWFYNKACLCQQIDDLEDCYKYLDKAIENLEVMLVYLKKREEQIAYSFQYVQSLLQLCAVMSQNGKHDQAIALAEKSLNSLIESFRSLESICYEHKLLSTQPETTQTTLQVQGSGEQLKHDRVNFKKILIAEAVDKLNQLSNLPSIQKLVQENKEYYEGIIKNIYFWKDNTENNEKILRKQFDADKNSYSSPRNILGLQKKSNWVDQFHIGTLMCLKPKKIKYLLSVILTKYPPNGSIQFSTQIRFNQFELDVDTVSISQRYKRLHNNEVIQKCKFIHVKALQIATKYLPPSNLFLNHLLSSFNKNYKFLLDQIAEESELTVKDFKAQQKMVIAAQYGIARQVTKVMDRKVTRKRSKTNDKLKNKNQPKQKQSANTNN